MGLMKILAIPFGYLMKGCYILVKNYGIALLLFTLITRLITLPLNIKQQKSTTNMTMLQPEIEKIKKKYGKNQDKVNEETMKLYAENNIKPTMGCLPMIISLVILYALIPVVYGPLTYISDADDDNISADSTLLANLYTISTEVDTDDRSIETLLEEIVSDSSEELSDEEKAQALGEVLSDSESYSESAEVLEGLTDAEADRLLLDFVQYDGLDGFVTDSDNFTQNLMSSSYGPEVLLFNFETKADGKYLGVLNDDVQQAIKEIDYSAFGLSLGKIPSRSDATVVIPFISFVLQLASMIISQIFSRRNNPDVKMNMSMMVMLFAMPLFSLYIGFRFPCALGIYWSYSSMFSVFQVIFLNIFYSPAKIRELVEKDIAKNKEKRKKKGPSMMEMALEVRNEQAANKKIEEKPQEDEEEEDGEEKKLTKAQLKELNRQKLNEARKRYAEKYGDEYKED